MAARFLAGTAALGLAALAATPATAQQIYYEDGEYLYAAPAPVMAQDAVVSQPRDDAPSVIYQDGVAYERVEPRIGARRVIASRNAPVQQPAPQQIILPAPQASYAYPAYAPVTYAAAPQVQPYVVAARSIPAQGYG